jgi:hypothetical protein
MANTGARLIIPDDLPVVDASVVTGENFRLVWPDGT